jgi:hypothetical protein
MKSLSSTELHATIDRALAEVSRRLASGELDQSGRYYSDEELRRQVPSFKPRRKSVQGPSAARRKPKSA